jgi:hypothetical protein
MLPHDAKNPIRYGYYNQPVCLLPYEKGDRYRANYAPALTA